MLGLSQLFIAFGGCDQKYYMMLVGITIFGMASDLLHLVMIKMIARRIPHCQGTAMGLILTVPELAAAMNSFLSPYLLKNTHSKSYLYNLDYLYVYWCLDESYYYINVGCQCSILRQCQQVLS